MQICQVHQLLPTLFDAVACLKRSCHPQHVLIVDRQCRQRTILLQMPLMRGSISYAYTVILLTPKAQHTLPSWQVLL